MKTFGWLVVVLLACVVQASLARSTALTFEMPEHSTECFMDELKKGDKVSIEFQVIYGGKLDVDVTVTLKGQQLYKVDRQKRYTWVFDAHAGGELQVCFSNKFSTFAHKTVFMVLSVTDIEEPNMEPSLTQIDTSLASLHDSLMKTVHYQTNHRMREAIHRKAAEYMNQRVQYMSAGEAMLVVLVSFFQVTYLKSLFDTRH